MLSWHKFERILYFSGLLPVIIFPLTMSIPAVGFIIEMGTIFLMIYYAYRRYYLPLILGGLGSLVLALALYGPGLLVISMWAKAIIPGAVFGRFLGGGVSVPRAFLVGIMLMTIVSLMIFQGEREAIYQVLDGVQKWMQDGLAGGSIAGQEQIDWMLKTVATIKRLTPSLMALSAVGQLFIGWILLILLLKSASEFVPSYANFHYWKMPDFYLFIAGLAIFIRLIGGETIKIVADNILFFIGFFYAAFGFAVFEYFLKKLKLSLFLRILFYIGFIFLQLPGLILAAAVGLFDSYFDFRKVKAKIIG